METELTEQEINEIIKKREKYLKQREYTYRWREKNREKYLKQQKAFYDKYMESEEYRLQNLKRVKLAANIKRLDARRDKRMEKRNQEKLAQESI